MYTYLQCVRCSSLYCDPMPDEDALRAMYGPSYAEVVDGDASDPEESRQVLDWLKRVPCGVFVDYGCGSGDLLLAVAKLGWQTTGVEFDPAVAAATSARTNGTVVTDLTSLSPGTADVLHLGDVIEHLTRVEEQMPRILALLKPGALLLAKGPLEANGNLFTATLKIARSLRRRPMVEMPPYHVTLATAQGQRIFFQRFGMEELNYRVSEVSWPAPARLHIDGSHSVRDVGLFVLRILSRSISHLRPDKWGNRYFFAGRSKGAESRAS